MNDHQRRFAAAAIVAAVALLAGCASSHGTMHSSASTTPSARAGSPRPSVASTRATHTSSPRATQQARDVAATAGQIDTMDIPGGVSGFAARPAEVYLPPSTRTDPTQRLPVLLLLHGSSGGPTSWLTLGHMVATMNSFAARHDGRTPIVVMPDINGAVHADTECVRTSDGANVEQYLSAVVPAWVSAHLPVTADHRDWSIAGLSEGGTCALVLALRHPTVFGYAGDFSGLPRLTLGSTDNPPLTIAKLFGGSRAAYDAHVPALLLARNRYPGLGAWFECGASDPVVLAGQRQLAPAALKAGMAVVDTTVPGKHSWTVWSAALGSMLPTIWARAA